MSLEKLHPTTLKRIQSGLPDGAVIKSVDASDAARSIFEVEIAGTVHELPLEKVWVDQFTFNQQLLIDATEGEDLNTVLKRVAFKYRIPMVHELDFDLKDMFVTFEGQDRRTEILPMAKTSVLFTGNITVILAQ